MNRMVRYVTKQNDYRHVNGTPTVLKGPKKVRTGRDERDAVVFTGKTFTRLKIQIVRTPEPLREAKSDS